MELAYNLNFAELTCDEMMVINGGDGSALIAAGIAAVFAAGQTLASAGYFGAAAKAIACTSVVTGAAAVIAVVGVVAAGYAVYSYYKNN